MEIEALIELVPGIYLLIILIARPKQVLPKKNYIINPWNYKLKEMPLNELGGLNPEPQLLSKATP
jgi:hypothetical protein